MELYEKEEYVYNQIPVRILKHSLEKENIYSPLHWHRSIEIDLAVEGRIVLVVDGKRKEMKAGEWKIVNSGELHSFNWVDRNDFYQGLTLLISKSFLDTWLKEDAYLTYPEDAAGQACIRELIGRIGEIKNRSGKFYRAELMEALFLLIRLLGEYCMDEDKEKSGKQPKGISSIKSIINYIDEHYKENLSLKDVAATYHYSSAYVSRLFKEHIGYNFYEYLQDVRLLNTVEQLKKSQDVLLIDCALENGFPNIKSFITKFKKTYNCTPSEWRKLLVY